MRRRPTSINSRIKAARLTETEADALEALIRRAGARPVADSLGVTPSSLDAVRHCGAATEALVARVRAAVAR